jgi:hypothetical protein
MAPKARYVATDANPFPFFFIAIMNDRYKEQKEGTDVCVWGGGHTRIILTPKRSTSERLKLSLDRKKGCLNDTKDEGNRFDPYQEVLPLRCARVNLILAKEEGAFYCLQPESAA